MYKYIGEDWDYQNLVPQVTVPLKHGQEYDIFFQDNSQTMVINGQVVNTEPSEVHVCFKQYPNVWIPYMPQLIQKHWVQL